MIFSDLIRRIYVILTEFLQVISTWCFFWFNWKNLRNIDGIFTSNFYM